MWDEGATSRGKFWPWELKLLHIFGWLAESVEEFLLPWPKLSPISTSRDFF